jgi:biopolymer transport protein ExbD
VKGLTDRLDETDDKPDLTPMIDCVFLLLLFFIVTSTFSEQTLFDVVLPKAAQAIKADTAQGTTLTIATDGRIAIGKDFVGDDDLYRSLAAIHKKQPIAMLVISGDEKAPYSKVVMAMDAARQLDISDVVFVVQQ